MAESTTNGLTLDEAWSERNAIYSRNPLLHPRDIRVLEIEPVDNFRIPARM